MQNEGISINRCAYRRQISTTPLDSSSGSLGQILRLWRVFYYGSSSSIEHALFLFLEPHRESLTVLTQ